MAKETGKRFKMPNPLFSNDMYKKLATAALSGYKNKIFDKSNPIMSDGQPFPNYTSKSYENRKKANKFKRQRSQYKDTTAPVLSGDLMLDTKASASPKEFAFYIGWTSHAYKLKHLENNGRILTNKNDPIHPDIIKKSVIPAIQRELKKNMPKGKHTITIGKKK